MSNDKINVVGTNIREKATVIWNVANHLFGYFKPHEYGLVILPMTVVKRFHDCLLPTWQAVQDTYEKVKHLAVIDGFLTQASGYQFYNTSKFNFDKLLADPENIEANFRDYLAGFSPNVQDVLSKFDFDTVIKRVVESGSLYLVRAYRKPALLAFLHHHTPLVKPALPSDIHKLVHFITHLCQILLPKTLIALI